MRMFLGEYSPSITEGSRIALPKKLREQIEEGEVMLSKGFEKCVFIYDKRDWVEKAQKRVENPRGDVRTEDLERYMYTSANEGALDSQGRVVIPPSLKKYAGITKDTAVLGVGDHIEVWDKETWEMYLEKLGRNLG